MAPSIQTKLGAWCLVRVCSPLLTLSPGTTRSVSEFKLLSAVTKQVAAGLNCKLAARTRNPLLRVPNTRHLARCPVAGAPSRGQEAVDADPFDCISLVASSFLRELWVVSMPLHAAPTTLALPGACTHHVCRICLQHLVVAAAMQRTQSSHISRLQYRTTVCCYWQIPHPVHVYYVRPSTAFKIEVSQN